MNRTILFFTSIILSALFISGSLGQEIINSTNIAFAEPTGCWPIHSTSTNSTGPNVYAVQYLAREQGQLIGVDGIYGNNTRNAIISIQASNGLSQDGIVGPNTWQSGLIVTRSSGSNGDAVRAIQHLLRYKFGYNIGNFGPNGDGVDGDFGNSTRTAVISFQQSRGLSADGIVGPNTWSELVCISSPPTSTPTRTRTPLPTNTATRTRTPTPINTPTNTLIPSTNTPAPTGCWPIHSTSTNSTGPNVYAIQYLARQQGQSISVDGIYGNNTLNAVIAVQAAKGLSQDGIVGPNTWRNGLVVTRRNGDSGDAVRAIQYLLRYKYFYDIGSFGPNGDGVDGSFGGSTQSAVIAFQQSKGLSADGIVGPNTWSALVCLDDVPTPPTNTPTNTPRPATATHTPAPATATNTPASPPPTEPPTPFPGTLVPTNTPNPSLCWSTHSSTSNNRGANVVAIQYLARAKGELIGVDGDYGSETTAAIRTIQGLSGLHQTGTVNRATWEQGLIFNMNRDAAGDGVRAVQYLLRYKHGYNIGNFGPNGDGVDGDFGPSTENGVIAFQRDNGLNANGQVEITTWSKLICLEDDEPNPPSGEKIRYPSGAEFDVIGLGQTEDSVDYSDPVTNGRIPLIDLQGRTGEHVHTHFTTGEFQTNDGARYARIDPDLVIGLQQIRSLVGGPLTVTSGYRHPQYNADQGGANSSRHMTGEAADIKANGIDTVRLAEIALEAMGCDIGIGLYATHVHVDTRGSLASWASSVTVNGQRTPPPMSEADFDDKVTAFCSGVPPTPTPPPVTIMPTPTRDVPPSGLCWTEHSRSNNSVGANVTAIQYLANFNGQAIGTDGIFGRNTESAIAALQRVNNLTDNGAVEALTWENALIETVVSGDKNDAVRAAQYLLVHKFGFDLGSFGPDGDGVDGDYGSMMGAAVQAFQQEADVTANGQVGADTWSALVCKTPDEITPPSPVNPTPVPTRPPGDNGTYVVHTTTQGFDTACAPNLSTMQTWANASPFDYVGIYLGGENALSSCREHNRRTLSQDWMAQTSDMGWRFIPIWVGPQATGSFCRSCSKIACDDAAARRIGREEARAALDRAEEIGLTDANGEGTILYYDLEGHDGTCRSASQALVDGWVIEVQASGNLAGLYGSSRASYMLDFENIPNPPDAMWFANKKTESYDPNISVYGTISGIPDDVWVGTRLFQYGLDFSDTYGGVEIFIDANAADGLVATSRFGGQNRRTTSSVAGLQRAPAANDVVHAINFISATTGWALKGDQLLITTDSGDSWAEIAPSLPNTARIDDIQFIDAQHGWIVTNDEDQVSIFKTENRGETWLQVSIEDFASGISADMFGDAHLTVINEATAWLSLSFVSGSAFSNGQLYKTTDGGATWTQLSVPLGEPVVFIDDSVGWVAGGAAGNELYRTNDGGNSWTQVPVVGLGLFLNQTTVGQPIFRTSQDGLLPVTVTNETGDTASIAIYETADGGDSWTLIEYRQTKLSSLVNGNLTSPTVDWLRTADSALLEQLDNVSFIKFVDGETGWAMTKNAICSGQRCNQENRILRTTDGGQTWTDLSIGFDDIAGQRAIYLPIVTR